MSKTYVASCGKKRPRLTIGGPIHCVVSVVYRDQWRINTLGKFLNVARYVCMRTDLHMKLHNELGHCGLAWFYVWSVSI